MTISSDYALHFTLESFVVSGFKKCIVAIRRRALACARVCSPGWNVLPSRRRKMRERPSHRIIALTCIGAVVSSIVYTVHHPSGQSILKGSLPEVVRSQWVTHHSAFADQRPNVVTPEDEYILHFVDAVWQYM